MISRHPYKEADISSLSDLRSGSRLVGVRLMREIVRCCDPAQLVAMAAHSVDRLVDEVSAVARDDAGPSGRREKAAEFIIHLRPRHAPTKSLIAQIDRVAEAAAQARYRSGRIVDFLSVWLFITGEQFIASLADHAVMLELEIDHPQIWNRHRLNILETLEAGSQRLAEGRRFRLAEEYLARIRLVRARNEERYRSDVDLLSPPAGFNAVGAEAGPDYVAAMIVDIFALSLSEKQQTLIVAQIPGAGAHGSRVRNGFAAHDHRRLWAPIRAVRTNQAFEKWSKLRQELGISRRQAIQEFSSGLTIHLRRTWEWFFPHRNPFGILRATLLHLEVAPRQEIEEDREDEFIDQLFRRYSETLSFIARLATEDLESPVVDGDEATAGGVL